MTDVLVWCHRLQFSSSTCNHKGTQGGNGAAAEMATGRICRGLRAEMVGEQKRFGAPRVCGVSHMCQQFTPRLLRGERSCWKAFSQLVGEADVNPLVRAGSAVPGAADSGQQSSRSPHMPVWRMGTGKRSALL